MTASSPLPLSPSSERRLHDALLVELEKVFPKLMKSLEPKDIMWTLRARNFLNYNEFISINQQRTRHERVQKLVGVLCQKRYWWGPLIDSLIRAGRGQLARVVCDAVHAGGELTNVYNMVDRSARSANQHPALPPPRSESAPEQGLARLAAGPLASPTDQPTPLSMDAVLDHDQSQLGVIHEEIRTEITVSDDEIVIVKESISHNDALCNALSHQPQVLLSPDPDTPTEDVSLPRSCDWSERSDEQPMPICDSPSHDSRAESPQALGVIPEEESLTSAFGSPAAAAAAVHTENDHPGNDNREIADDSESVGNDDEPEMIASTISKYDDVIATANDVMDDVTHDHNDVTDCHNDVSHDHNDVTHHHNDVSHDHNDVTHHHNDVSHDHNDVKPACQMPVCRGMKHQVINDESGAIRPPQQHLVA